MSVEFLNSKDIKKSLSGQKKKKNRTKKKNILSLPEKLYVKNPELSSNSASTLTEILENLLPHAKLPPNSRTGRAKNKSSTGSEEAALSEIRLKRNQLLLGINVVSRGVQNNMAACVITADDIAPKLMASHLKLLCASKMVPLVTLPQLRELTQRTLGFPCIALGIKRNSFDFLPAVEPILSTVTYETDSKRTDSDDSEMEISPESDDDGKDETGEKEECFAYLYRNVRNGTRAFVPELHGAGDKSTNKDQDFIALGAYSEKSDSAAGTRGAGAVENIPHEQNPDSRKRKRKFKCDSGPGNAADTQIEYSMAKVMKLDSNPVRKSEKYKKLKK